MRIEFAQYGGFAGVELKSLFNSASMHSNEVQTLRSLLDSAKFFDLPSRAPPSPRNGADYLEYKIVVDLEDGRIHSVTTNDLVMSSELARLVAFLRRKANDAAMHERTLK